MGVHLPLRVLIVLVRVGFTPHYNPGLPSTEGNTGFIVRSNSHSKGGGGPQRGWQVEEPASLRSVGEGGSEASSKG